MNDPEKQLRETYARESLAPERVQAILQAGEAARAARRRRQWWARSLAVAAVLVGGFIVGGRWTNPTLPERVSAPVVLAREAVESRVVAFFDDPAYVLDLEAMQPQTLVDWMKSRGGPAALTVPAALAELDSLGCRVLDLGGAQAFILCFYLDGVPRDEAGNPMPGKRAMTVAAPADSPAAPPMMKPATLFHLIAVPRRHLADASLAGLDGIPGKRGDWNVATWSDADLVFFAISQVDAERFAATIASLAG